MKIMVLGLRGFPGVMGGVETHCENLYPRIQRLGCEVVVLARSPYMEHDEWSGIQFKRLWTPKRKSLETILHSLLGVLVAAFERPDILHIHAIGPAIVTPLARMAGLKVVVTHHGEDYERQKWGRFARWVLRCGEALGMRYANQRIVISKKLENLVRKKFAKASFLIPNGVQLDDRPAPASHLSTFGLEAGRYVLIVGRLVPEKRHHDLIAAFEKAQLPGWKLAIVGDSDHPDEYSERIKASAQRNPDIVCTGFQSGAALRSLFSNAGLFVLPSSHEGNPIAVLEALGFGLPVLLSNIEAHLELDLPESRYFALGDIESLAHALALTAGNLPSDSERKTLRAMVEQRYNWDTIASQVFEIYKLCLNPEKPIGSGE